MPMYGIYTKGNNKTNEQLLFPISKLFNTADISRQAHILIGENRLRWQF